MSDDLSLKFDIASEDAVAGVEAVNTALGKTKAAASDATVGLTGIESATKTLQAALDKLAASDGPRGMIKNAALAQVALEQYKATAVAAGVSTTDMAARVNAAGAQISGAADKVGIFKKAQADLAAQGAMTGSQLDKLRQSGTTLTGMFDQMERTGTGLTKTVGAIGVGIGIASVAFVAAEAAGKKLGETLAYLIDKHTTFMEVANNVALTTQKYTDAQRALAAGLITTSDSVSGLIANYDNLVLASGRGSAAAKQLALGFTDAQMAALSYGAETAKAETLSAALEGQFKNMAVATDDVAKKTTALTLERQKSDAALATGNVTGGAASDILWREAQASDALVIAQAKATSEQFKSNQMIKEAEPLLKKTEAAYRSMGEAVPASIRSALDALQALKTRQDDATEAMKRAMVVAKDIPASMQKQIDESKALAEATKLVADSHDKLLPSLVKTLEALHEGKISTAEATAELAAYATANKLTVAQVMTMVTEQSNLSERLGKTDAAFAAQIGTLSDAALKMGTYAEKVKDAAMALAAMNAEADRQTASIKARNTAIDEAIKTTDDFAAAQRNGIAVQGQATVVTIALATATKEATAGLVEMLKEQNLYTDSLQKTLSVATGWSDYLANLKQSYDQGVTSIIQYKLALEAFLHTLQTQFVTATGNAKKSLEEMIAAVQKLINTAGASPQNTDYSAGGALNRAMNGP